jgi:hypothetical protein
MGNLLTPEESETMQAVHETAEVAGFSHFSDVQQVEALMKSAEFHRDFLAPASGFPWSEIEEQYYQELVTILGKLRNRDNN